jgi:hypothetical protein
MGREGSRGGESSKRYFVALGRAEATAVRSKAGAYLYLS